MYGGRALSNSGQSGIEFVESTCFEPGGWGFNEVESVYAFEDAKEVFNGAIARSNEQTNGGSRFSPRLFYYYLIATDGVASEMYILLFEDNTERVKDPLLCINVHFRKRFKQSELEELGYRILDRIKPLVKEYAGSRKAQCNQAVSLIKRSTFLGNNTAGTLALLEDIEQRVDTHGELFDFQNISSVIETVDWVEESRDGRKAKAHHSRRRNNLECKGLVANPELFLNWLKRLDSMLKPHGRFRYSYGLCYGMPLVHFTVQIPRGPYSIPEKKQSWMDGISSYVEMFERLAPLLTSRDFFSRQLESCLERSQGRWERMLVLVCEGKIINEASGGSVSIIENHSAFKRDLGIRFEFPSAKILSSIS